MRGLTNRRQSRRCVEGCDPREPPCPPFSRRILILLRARGLIVVAAQAVAVTGVEKKQSNSEKDSTSPKIQIARCSAGKRVVGGGGSVLTLSDHSPSPDEGLSDGPGADPRHVQRRRVHGRRLRSRAGNSRRLVPVCVRHLRGPVGRSRNRVQHDRPVVVVQLQEGGSQVPRLEAGSRYRRTSSRRRGTRRPPADKDLQLTRHLSCHSARARRRLRRPLDALLVRGVREPDRRTTEGRGRHE